jgi:aminopeptidase N
MILPDGGAMLRRLTLLGFATWFTSSAVLLGSDTYPRQPDIDILHYVFGIELTDVKPEIIGDVTVTVRFMRQGVSSFELDLTSAASGKGMTVTAVTSDSVPVPFTHIHHRLRLTVSPASAAEERRSFRIEYHGVPSGGLRMLRNSYGEWCAFAQNWPDHTRDWLPTIDHPYDRATSEFLITAPSKYQVVANGALDAVLDLGDGRRQTHRTEAVPIAAWANAIGVEQFFVH